MSRSLVARVARFGIVGAINTGVYYGTYLLVWHISPYLVAHVAGFVVATVGSYLLNCAITFRTRPTWRKFALFPLSTVTNFCVQTAGLYVLVAVVGMNERYAPLPAAAVAVPVTFLVAQKILVERPADPRPEDPADKPHRQQVRT